MMEILNQSTERMDDMKVNLPTLLMAQGLGLLIVMLTGCSAGSGGVKWYLADKQTMLEGKGNPPSYIQGYLDGCSSGRRMGGDKRFAYKKDEARASVEALYERGWQEGNICCKNETLTDAYERQYEKGTTGSAIDIERNRRVQAESAAAEAEMREIWEELKK